MDQVAQGRVGAFLEQRGAVTRCQDRIDDDRCALYLGQGEQHIPDDVVGRQHADLDRIRADDVEGRTELLQQHRREDGEHPADLQSVLDRERGRHGRAVDTVGLEDLKVGLEAGAAGRVGASNREYALHAKRW